METAREIKLITRVPTKIRNSDYKLGKNIFMKKVFSKLGVADFAPSPNFDVFFFKIVPDGLEMSLMA